MPSYRKTIVAILSAATVCSAAAQSTHRGPTAAGQHAGAVTTDQDAKAAATPATTPQMAALPHRQLPNAELGSDAVKERVEKLLKEMTVDEKVGQLAQFTGGQRTGPGTGLTSFEDMLAKGEIGSLFNVVEPAKVNGYQRIAMEKSRLKIPVLFGYDVIHGYKTEFPVPLALASSWNPDLVERTARMAAQEASQDGIRWVFSPMVDIARDARWGRIVESAGEDPVLGSAIARAYVRGYQGKSLAEPDSVAASVKHFAAYGAAEAGRDYNTTDMSDLALRRTYLVPYHAAVDAGAATLMSSFNALNGVPATANPYLLTRILRREWNFQGFVVSDYGAVKELEAHGIAADDSTAAFRAIMAGLDMDMESGLFSANVPELVKDGKVPAAVLDEAVRRILRVKVAMGLFEHPYAIENAPPYAATPERRALAREAAEQSVILLKNMGVLPLKRDVKSVALIGPHADDQAEMLGSWSAQGNARDVVTLRAALQQRLGAHLVYAKGTDVEGTTDAGFADAVKAARSADVVLLCVGENADTQTGEAASRTRLDLPGNQQQLLEAVAATGKPLVVLVFSGRPLVLTNIAPRAAALVQAWYPGIEAGPALANLLFGDANFSARATVSFPRAVGQEPLYYAQLPTGRPAPASVDLTRPPDPNNGDTKYLSRYIDEQNSALYPFGFGLSYASFRYSQPTISAASVTAGKLTPKLPGQPADEHITVGVDVTNTGSVAGVTVPQLYIRANGTQVEQPVRELRAFERITLAPGETKHVDFKLGFDELSIYGFRNVPGIEPADYTIYVGEDSTAQQNVKLKIEPDPRPAPPKPVAPVTGAQPQSSTSGTPQNPVPLVPLPQQK